MIKKLGSDERGIGHLLVIVLGVVVIAAVGVVGWRVASNNKKTPASSSASTTVASTAADTSCLASYHDSRLCSFASNSTSFDKTAYTATITITQSGATSTMTLENDGKGNTDLSGTGSGQVVNAISLDGNNYIQTNGSGPWIEYPAGTSAPASNPTSSMNIGVGSTTISYKYIGTATCGSLTCYKYAVTDKLTPAATQTVLFDTSSYKLRQWNYTDGSGNTTDMTITYGSVNITAPTPVETLSQAE